MPVPEEQREGQAGRDLPSREEILFPFGGLLHRFQSADLQEKAALWPLPWCSPRRSSHRNHVPVILKDRNRSNDRPFALERGVKCYLKQEEGIPCWVSMARKGEVTLTNR